MESISTTSHNQEMADEHVTASVGTLTNETPPEIPMDDLRRYEILSRLGNGAHGVVMKAKDTVTQGYVAIKFTYQ